MEGLPVNRPGELVGGVVTIVRGRFSAVASQSERTLMLGTILVLSALSGASVFVFTQYYSVDVLSSLAFRGDDCPSVDLVMQGAPRLGRHCFSDYAFSFAWRANPWEPTWPNEDLYGLRSVYPAAGMVPQWLFGLVGQWLNAPGVGLFGYVLALAAAVLSPAVWAAKGTHGLERVVVFVALGAAAIPAWTAVDRGNLVGFVAPVALGFLLGLHQQRWGNVAAMVVLAALIKPQFAVLVVVLFAARRWRWGGIALIGVVISNLAAYLLWPQDFPKTIPQSIHAVLGFGSLIENLVSKYNVSFANALLLIPDGIAATNAGGEVPNGFFAGPRSLLGYATLVVGVCSVVALGRRIPPVMVGIVLLATASLFPAFSGRYYLVFVLPIAALVARDPGGAPGSGIFDRFGPPGDRRRAVGVCVSLATAVSIAQVALPPTVFTAYRGPEVATPIVDTTAGLVAIAWLIAIAAIIFSYARTPAAPWSRSGGDGVGLPTAPNTDAGISQSLANKDL